ncbi:MAG: tRNA pseudouridine(55) synthase TruB [SAR202 cluster bacterium Io17-Chloro-G7]|nr:MAG: tRNA pseudouridine(55) synthase TruB [SAR202 cluster bacterium Io17-Chloro-G7]
MAKPKNGPPQKNGFVNLYKPVGITSMDALRQVKRITGQRNKVGHGGTMDPLARGVLPVCFGQATRLMDFVVGGRKRYMMEITLGVSTTTYDAEGETIQTRDATGISMAHIEEALPAFVGAIDQVPPMYSAIKVQGQRLYKLARAGIEIEREARPVDIFDIRVENYQPPVLTLEVDCGKGAYMRSIAHDLGEVLGCGGHVVDLVRLSTGRFHADDSITPDQLEESTNQPGGWEEHLHPIDWVLKDFKSISVGKQAENLLRNGQSVNLGPQFIEAAYLEEFRVYSTEGRFLALVRFDRPANSWRPVKVFQIDTPSPLAPGT